MLRVSPWFSKLRIVISSLFVSLRHTHHCLSQVWDAQSGPAMLMHMVQQRVLSRGVSLLLSFHYPYKCPMQAQVAQASLTW